MAFYSPTQLVTNNNLQQKFDVFVNFRGEDIRYNFLSHLIAALNQASLDIFVDDKIKRGDEINHALMSAIENSKLSLTIFSPGYVSSRWCLNELVKIMECRENPRINQIVIPVFYHVASADVKGQRKSFAKAFKELENSKYPENRINVPIWKAAMTKAGDLSGRNVKEKSPESDVVVDIVNDVLIALGRPPMENKVDHSSNYVKLIHTIELQVKGKIWTPSSSSSQGIHIESLDSLLNMLKLQAPPSSFSLEWNPQTNSTYNQALAYGQTEGFINMGSSGSAMEWNPQTNSSYRQTEGSNRLGTSSGSCQNISYPTTTDLYLSSERDKVVLFVTSISIVEEIVEHCDAVRELLKALGVSVDERNTLNSSHREELRDVLEGKPMKLPALFVDGEYIGGYEEIMEFNESGELEEILQDHIGGREINKLTDVNVSTQTCSYAPYTPSNMISSYIKISSSTDTSSHLSGTEDQIVLYFTSSEVSKRIYEECREVRMIFRELGVLVDERNTFATPDCMKELTNVLMKNFYLPRVFIRGKHIGGVDEIRELNETGKLKWLVDGFPIRNRPSYCEACGELAMMVCPYCGHGQLCSECDDTRMIKCPDCQS